MIQWQLAKPIHYFLQGTIAFGTIDSHLSEVRMSPLNLTTPTVLKSKALRRAVLNTVYQQGPRGMATCAYFS
ncbi:hypothetical protein B5X24_HaOG208168 [Helicoverpa armigera]|uniref:Uncharacterized protein n=1 Tax=Helicoverpa armigera TaxID=29058 RepID=A0A2W1BGP6_HELAM|nr:hypothetical protein B5X24_HaOG208168 [Helicoverpa armigera]